MILDLITNFNIYTQIHHNFKTVLDFLQKNDISAFPAGKHEISNGIFAISSRYKTVHASTTFIECHKKYIDIQIMVKGSEKMGICNRDKCLKSAYNKVEDYQKLKGNMNFITVHEGYFTVFFPHDAHMPQLVYNKKPEEVRKMVIKVPV